MNVAAWRAIAVADSRVLMRDPLLGWVLLLPLGLALMLRVLIPLLEGQLFTIGFDLSRYHELIMSGYLMTAPGIVGMVIGFLLLDERDAGTLRALRVTPLAMWHFLAYRMIVPLLLGTASTLFGYALTGLTRVAYSSLLPIAAVAALSAPTLALVLAAVAPNKVAGFAVVKVMNVINLAPLVAYFIPMPAQLLVGILPPFWPMRALWAVARGQSGSAFIIAGAVVSTVALALSAAWFERRSTRRA